MKKIIVASILLMPLSSFAYVPISPVDVSINEKNQPCFSAKWPGKDLYYLSNISVSERNQSEEIWRLEYKNFGKKHDISTRKLCVPYGITIVGTKTVVSPKPLQFNKPYEVIIRMSSPRISANLQYFRSQFCLAKENNVLAVKKVEDNSCTNENFTIKERSWFERLFG